MRPVLAFIPVGGDTQTVTSGTLGSTPNRQAGFFTGKGSVVDGTSNLYSGAAIVEIYWDENGGSPFVHFTVAGTQPNGGWNQMVIDGAVTLTRVAGVYGSGGGQTVWEWNVASNPFGTNGSVHTVVFS